MHNLLFIYLMALRWKVKDNRLYIKRVFESRRNEIQNPRSCVYCNGAGYLTCRHCENGCWRCNDSTLTTCGFCSGDGKGRYAYVKI